MAKSMTQPNASNRQLVILDQDTPWITSLLNELPATWKPIRMGARSVGLTPTNWWRAFRDGVIGIPGWTRAFTLSTLLMSRAVSRSLAKIGRPRAIVHTMPWTAGLLRNFPDQSHVYRPQDSFGLYEWDQKRVLSLETELMNNCRVAMPMSPEHAGDLRQLGSIPIEIVPNGVSTEFLNILRNNGVNRPNDLPPATEFIVGCIGQINSYYDWPLIVELAKQMPDVRFVFVGPIIEENAAHRREIQKVFQLSNLTWLGSKPHRELPGYLYHFDVCFSPLLVTRANNRRSLLRLYDYLASDRPVISTPVAAAKSHGAEVLIGATANEITELILDVRAHRYKVNREARRIYSDQHTWARRGLRFTEIIETFCPDHV